MNYEEFCEGASSALGIDPLGLPPTAALHEDWDLDSFDLVILTAWLEEGFVDVLQRVPMPHLLTMGYDADDQGAASTFTDLGGQPIDVVLLSDAVNAGKV